MWLEEEKSESKGMGRLSQSLVGHDEDSGSCINRARGTGVASSDLCIEGISVVTQVRTDKRGQRQSRRRSWKATVLIQVRDNVGPNWMVALEVRSGQILDILKEDQQDLQMDWMRNMRERQESRMILRFLS